MDALEESIARLREIWEADGPFDGIMGVSTGACLVAMLFQSLKWSFNIILVFFASQLRAKGRRSLFGRFPGGLPSPFGLLFGRLQGWLSKPTRSRALIRCSISTFGFLLFVSS